MEELFVCSSCESRLPASAFSSSNRDSPDGPRRRYTVCRSCVTARTRKWRAEHREQARKLNARAKARLRSDPVRHAREREVENARRRSKTRRGEIVASTCKRCDTPFEYEFIQRSRDLCEPCRTHPNDWKVYGLTGPEAIELRSRNACDICGSTQDPGGRFNEWQIDHCHDSGKVRGLLCSACNTVLGLMGNDPARLRAAADYLTR